MPLADRNTTLRHPSADTSANACMESPDEPIVRSHTWHASLPLLRTTNTTTTGGSSRHGRPKNSLPRGSTSAAAAGVRATDGSDDNGDDNLAGRGSQPLARDAEMVMNPDGVGVAQPASQRAGKGARWGAQGGRRREGGEKKRGVLTRLRLHKVW